MVTAGDKPGLPLSASVASLLTLAILVSLPVSGQSALGPQSRDQAPRTVETATTEQAHAQEDRPDSDQDPQQDRPTSQHTSRDHAGGLSSPTTPSAFDLSFGEFALPPPAPAHTPGHYPGHYPGHNPDHNLG